MTNFSSVTKYQDLITVKMVFVIINKYLQTLLASRALVTVTECLLSHA